MWCGFGCSMVTHTGTHLMGFYWTLDAVFSQWEKNTLKGLQPRSLSIISSHRMENILNNISHGVIAQLHFIQMQPSVVSTTPLDIQKNLDRYACVFSDLVGLPPSRPEDHHIMLLLGSFPPIIRLYRYPFHQNIDIEMLVRNSLKQGFIFPSTSSFSSPGLLAWKKGGSWWHWISST